MTITMSNGFKINNPEKYILKIKTGIYKKCYAIDLKKIRNDYPDMNDYDICIEYEYSNMRDRKKIKK